MKNRLVLGDCPGSSRFHRSSRCRTLLFSPDGRQVLTGGADRSVRLWDLDQGKEIERFGRHSDAITGLAFWQDGRHVLAGSRDAAVRVWQIGKKNSGR